MKTKTKLLAGVAMVVAMAAPAVAADMRMPVKAPPPVAVAVYNWTGFYIGGHAGYGWGRSDVDTSPLPTPAAFGADPFSQRFDVDGFVAGGQIGYNFQTGRWVFGIELDASATGLDGSQTVGPLPLFGGGFDPGSSQTASSELKWLATARLRGGLLVTDYLLLYVTGGLAVGKVEDSVVTDYVGDPFRYPGSNSDVRFGWTVGGGGEWALGNNWSIKAEYLYVDLGDETIIANPVAANPPFQVSTNHEFHAHIARVGLNYRFGAAPLVARY
jgi:outer membrane immunogenic protein